MPRRPLQPRIILRLHAGPGGQDLLLNAGAFPPAVYFRELRHRESP